MAIAWRSHIRKETRSELLLGAGQDPGSVEVLLAHVVPSMPHGSQDSIEKRNKKLAAIKTILLVRALTPHACTRCLLVSGF